MRLEPYLDMLEKVKKHIFSVGEHKHRTIHASMTKARLFQASLEFEVYANSRRHNNLIVILLTNMLTPCERFSVNLFILLFFTLPGTNQ